jgi:hypothetical protein
MRGYPAVNPKHANRVTMEEHIDSEQAAISAQKKAPDDSGALCLK